MPFFIEYVRRSALKIYLDVLRRRRLVGKYHIIMNEIKVGTNIFLSKRDEWLNNPQKIVKNLKLQNKATCIINLFINKLRAQISFPSI